ncbi:MAG: glycosyltransferase family 39 protein [Candidatus Gastranaerophilales bacterium]|nr:glycosyltransferase family 39 protein [Candidatus Gastranaerophilales bacterium]
MKEFLKDNKVILIIILLVGFALRMWNLDKPEGLWNDEYLSYYIASQKFPFDFFEAIKKNCHAPLYYFYVKVWQNVFNNSDFMLRLSSLVPNLLACFVMYKVGKNYQTKAHSIQIGLACALISAISSFLIYFSQEVRLYSLVFLFSALILLYSIKMYEFPCKKHAWWLTLWSVLLIFTHTIGFVYVIFNVFGLMAFRPKKKKETDLYIPIVAGLILSLPLIPFLFRIFAHPTYFSQWWAPFSWSKIFFYFTDLFSPVLKNITNAPASFYHQIIHNDVINIGFIMFALVPAGIALLMIIRSNIDSKRINKYFLSVFFATFLTVLMASIAGKLIFLTKYLIELYPILILMFAIGWAQMNSRNSKIMLATVYIFMTMFYILFARVSAVKLIRNEGHRLPIVAMQEMNIQKNDKILFLYYPKKYFLKYYNDSDYVAYSIDKYNFATVLNKGTTYDAYKEGHKLYKVFF